MNSNTNNDRMQSYNDPLLECLVIMTKLNHRTFSQEALRAGLPLVNNRVTPALFIRAAERVGFACRLLDRSLKQISNLVLPAVLLLKNDQACVLHKITEKTAEIIMPEDPEATISIPLEELAKNYMGEIILMKPVFKFETHGKQEGSETEGSSWFFGTLWRYRYLYSQVMLAALFVNIFTLVGPLFIMNVYDRVVPNYAETTLWVLAIGVVIIYCFDFVLRVLRSYLIDIAGKKADLLMTSSLFEHVLAMQISNKPKSVGGFTNNLREFDSLRDFFTSATLTTIVDLPFTLLFFLLIWYLGGILVLIPLVVVPFIFISTLILEKPLNQSVRKMIQGMAQKNAILVEAMGGIEVIKALGAEGQIQHKLEQNVASTANFGLKSRFISTFISTVTIYSQQIVLVAIMVLGVYLIHANLLTVGGLIACNILANRILAPIAQLNSLLSRYSQAKLALQTLNKMMAAPTERPAGKHFIHRPHLQGSIQFEQVSFRYPEEKNLTLENINFKINPGERIGIIGRMGSGKTTLQKLILGLYPATSGTILLDGIDIGQIDPADLRSNIAYVPQDSLLFMGNLRDNIAMGMPWADDAAILKVAKLAGIDSFVDRHPAGYSMRIGERGEGLSGGQRQAIAIARAILSGAPICLFDEPSSSMDNATEFDLIKRLQPYLQNKTLLLITHRVPLFALVERLILMDAGHIVLDGPKEQVLARLRQISSPPQKTDTTPDGKSANS